MHQPLGGIGGVASDIKIQAEQHDPHEEAAGRADRAAHRARPSSRSPTTPTATGGSPPRRRRTTASSTTSSPPSRTSPDMWIDPTARAGASRETAMTPYDLSPSDPQGRYILPAFEERTAYGFKKLDPYTKLFEERIIFLGVPIDDASANDVMAQLLTLESIDPDRDIFIYINSPGGSFTALTAIYDTMQFVKPDIQTVCMGQAASAAAVLLAAGTPGKRLRPAELPDPHPPALQRGRRPGERHRDPGQRDPADALAARGDDRPAQRPHPGAGQQGHRARQDPHAPRRPSSTAWSTGSSCPARRPSPKPRPADPSARFAALPVRPRRTASRPTRR